MLTGVEKVVSQGEGWWGFTFSKSLSIFIATFLLFLHFLLLLLTVKSATVIYALIKVKWEYGTEQQIVTLFYYYMCVSDFQGMDKKV